MDIQSKIIWKYKLGHAMARCIFIMCFLIKSTQSDAELELDSVEQCSRVWGKLSRKDP